MHKSFHTDELCGKMLMRNKSCVFCVSASTVFSPIPGIAFRISIHQFQGKSVEQELLVVTRSLVANKEVC